MCEREKQKQTNAFVIKVSFGLPGITFTNPAIFEIELDNL